MNSHSANLNRQQGAVSLLTAMVLLTGVSLVVLTTSKTVLVETQIGADNYRTSQAVAAANYGLDYGVDYTDENGFDQVSIAATSPYAVTNGPDNLVDFTTPPRSLTVPNLTSAFGGQTTSVAMTFDNTAGTRCVPAGATPDMTNGTITATGRSDDGVAVRTITQCVGPLNILRGSGPKQPLVTQGTVALTGNARIINRYTNTTIWSGSPVQIGSSSAMETYINSSTDPADTESELINTNDGLHTQLVSNRNLGKGLDIIDDDPSLGGLIGLAFFKNFFAVESRNQLKQLAISNGQYYTAISSAITTPVKSGLIWIEGNQTMNGGTIGSATDPAILIVNGDMTIGGNATIYGLLYVAGTYTVNGTPQIVGANIVEGSDLATETPATPPIVSGTGTMTLIYWPGFAEAGTGPAPGLSAVVSGSWRDW